MPNFAELTIGDIIANSSFEITRDSLVRYAGASGDFNPIHYRDDVAQSVGLPGVLAHGMLTMGLAVQPVIDWLGDAARVVDYGVRFTRPVVVPAQGNATLNIIATIAQLDAEALRARVDLSCSFEEDNVLGKAQVWVQL
jgi:acyl dehydratase